MSDITECTCPEDSREIKQEEAVDIIVVKERKASLVARYSKDCPSHGYTVEEV